MPKRKALHHLKEENPAKKTLINVNVKQDSADITDIEIPDLSTVNVDEIENTIFDAVRRSGFSNAKAKYLIKQMLRHPSVIDWFRDAFSAEKGEFSMSYEPRVTRGARRRGDDQNGDIIGCNGNGIDAGMIGRLLLAVPTITSTEFDEAGDDGTDIDYRPESDQSESDQSSVATDCVAGECDVGPLSPYLTRSRRPVEGEIEELLVDTEPEEEEDEDGARAETTMPPRREALSLEQMCTLMDTDVDTRLYDEFKRSLNMMDMDDGGGAALAGDDDPEFDVFAQIDDLDEDIFDDCRDDRSVKIPKSELWALLKDNHLVAGSESSSSNKRTLTLLCEKPPASDGVPGALASEPSLVLTAADRARLQRQTSMFYQTLATAALLLHDTPHLAPLLAAQTALLGRLAAPAANRPAVETLLRDFRGLSVPPPAAAAATKAQQPHKRVHFPRCLLATLLCSPAFPHRELLPASYRVFSASARGGTACRTTPFLASEDRLLALGLLLYRGSLRLLHRLLFPTRSPAQLRYRRTNLLRRCDPLAAPLAALLQLHRDPAATAAARVPSALNHAPPADGPLWLRRHEWRLLPEVYLRFLRRAVPDTMFQLGLCGKDECTRLRRAARIPADRPAQVCNWSALPWAAEAECRPASPLRPPPPPAAPQRRPRRKPLLRKVVKEKSFPQYEIPEDSTFLRLLHKWNSLHRAPAPAPACRPRRAPARSEAARRAATLVKRARSLLITARSRRASVSRLSYAHYYRAEDTEKLFPDLPFRARLEDLMAHTSQKSLRLLRFHAKCRLHEGDIVDAFAPLSSNRDEDDLRFCRGLLGDLQARLGRDHYERCLERLYHFHLDEAGPDCEATVLDLMQYLLSVCKDHPDLYEDVLSLLTPLQACKLGLEIECHKVNNFNQLYSMVRSTRKASSRRFWIRLSAHIAKIDQSLCPISRATLYLTNNLKHNPYLQSLIAPLLNCWETPFPNFPETFANSDFLASESGWQESAESSGIDCWEYCAELAEPSKGPCGCSCHDNVSSKEYVAGRHCIGCGLKVAHGALVLDEGRIHKRLVRVRSPQDACAPPTLTNRPPPEPSVSVLAFLRGKGARPVRLHGRSISLKALVSPAAAQAPAMSPCTYQYTQLLIEDGDAAVDADLFRQVKGVPPAARPWTDDDNMRLLSECRRLGPSPATFAALQGTFFPGRALPEVEAQFNLLFQQLLEYRQLEDAR